MEEDANLDTMLIDLSHAELYEVVIAMVNRAETLVSMRAPKVVVNQTIKRAEKLNRFLKKSGCDYYTKEKFIDLKEKARYESFQ